ncbi:hypothetical protein J437_LFUL015251 [Ladona fulva]|uniref:Uncharacterized protein n=1 Tax=Ladona fulva TaxID=123851 RepID=A0A8K0KKE9_LADFU|nr:hypothetical protein J437_LFUL015251 [Ladona fulva]
MNTKIQELPDESTGKDSKKNFPPFFLRNKPFCFVNFAKIVCQVWGRCHFVFTITFLSDFRLFILSFRCESSRRPFSDSSHVFKSLYFYFFYRRVNDLRKVAARKEVDRGFVSLLVAKRLVFVAKRMVFSREFVFLVTKQMFRCYSISFFS